MLEENENHARPSQIFITTTVRNNYNGIRISTEINSCYRKIIIFYLNSNATRITWQQHTSIETMLVLGEGNTLGPEVMDGHLDSVLKGTQKYLNLFASLWWQKGSHCSPKWRQREQMNPPSSAARMGSTEPEQTQRQKPGKGGFFHEGGSKKEGIPSSSLDAGDIRTVLGLLKRLLLMAGFSSPIHKYHYQAQTAERITWKGSSLSRALHKTSPPEGLSTSTYSASALPGSTERIAFSF